MNYKFSDRISTVQPSVIREILKSTADPNVIPFAAGNPSPEAFPAKQIENISAIVLKDNPISALQYSISEGYPALRTAIKAYTEGREEGLNHENDDILIVSGGQQGIDLTTKCLVNEGDVVLVERPTFANAINTFRTHGAHLVGVSMDEDGINLESLEAAIKSNKNIKILYTIPNFQNPTGITMSLEKRKAVYDICRTNGIVILEDNPYGDLRYDGDYVPAIKTLDTDGIVAYVGSFSKVIAPGIRIGYVVAHKNLMPKLVVAKQCSDVHSNILAQIICERFLSTSNIKSHLHNLQMLYTAKMNLMMENLQINCGDKLTWETPSGGLFLWCTLPQHIDMLAFCKAAAEAGVAVVPGNAFYVDEHATCHSFRVNFSTPTNQQIIRGAEIICEVLKQF